MPSRNIAYRTDFDGAWYHVYGRGNARMPIFIDDEDNIVFLNLLKRYLSGEEHRDKLGRLTPNYCGKIELAAFCLMGNHFHLLIHQIEQGNLSKFMQGLVGSYGRYFNRKYQRSGSLLESRYKASLITSDDYLLHASRYIHLNPDDYENWSWSSLPYYIGKRHAQWLKPDFILGVHAQYGGDYKSFVDEYKTNRTEIDENKTQYLDDYDEPSANYYTDPDLLKGNK
jgi:REP element-mobilizing transposase RayT